MILIPDNFKQSCSSFIKRPYVRRILIELLRLSPLLGLAGLIILPDDARGVVLFGLAIVLLAVAVAHGVRKLIFPYIDVKTLVEKVKENSIACAMVICGLIYLLANIIQAFVVLYK